MMFYPESKPEINRDKVIQWGCNGVAIALSLSAPSQSTLAATRKRNSRYWPVPCRCHW
jgi:hypothetical protein